MSSGQHPFASTRYARLSRSAEALGRWLRRSSTTIEEPLTSAPPSPVPALDVSSASGSLTSIDAVPTPSRPPANLDDSIKAAVGSPGHFVMHSSKVTLLLSGQHNVTNIPVYTNGSTLEGILAVARPAGLLALEVVVSLSVLAFRTPHARATDRRKSGPE